MLRDGILRTISLFIYLEVVELKFCYLIQVPGAAILRCAALAAVVTVSGCAQFKAVPLENAKLYGDEVITTPYGAVQLEDTFIADSSRDMLYDAMDLQRATQGLYLVASPCQYG